jgi:hypothetical protein
MIFFSDHSFLVNFAKSKHGLHENTLYSVQTLVQILKIIMLRIPDKGSRLKRFTPYKESEL